MEQEAIENSKLLINKWKDELEKAITSRVSDDLLIQKLNSDMKEACLVEESYWKQRSRNLWLSLGDRNSGYFHAITKGRNAINNFSVLEGDEGNYVFSEEVITDTIVKYFTDLFTSVPSDRLHMVSRALVPQVFDAENQALISTPSAKEIHMVLLAIHPDKSPGLDGFSASFFQTNWTTVGPEIVAEIQTFFTSGVIPRYLNDTHVRLIPKSTRGNIVADYRPVANLISENQSAIVQDRAIADNILNSHEVLHYLKTSEASKRCSMTVKTDMSKAYDRLE